MISQSRHSKRDPKTGQFVSNKSNGADDRHTSLVVNQRFHQQLIENAMALNTAVLSRKDLLDSLLDVRKDINDECGYPDTSSIKVNFYRDLYEREAVAARVVEVLPKECWKTVPKVFEDEDADNETEFETAWKALGSRLLIEEEDDEESLFNFEEGNPIWEYLLRADILSGIGAYGVILLGLDDGEDLDKPVTGSDHELMFIRVFPQHLADITVFEEDATNRRFGKPVEYSLTFMEPTRESSSGSIGAGNLKSQKVHWSRVVHIADNLGSSEIIGVSRMRPVLNNLINIRKLYGGSAEMYWRGAFPGISFESHPQLGGEVEGDLSSLKDEMEQYMNGLQRYLKLIGFSAKSLAPQVVDPTPQINVQIEAICVNKGIPKRIFTGSERGELASSQDDTSWDERITHRREMYLTPRVIVPFITRLIKLGVLPKPSQFNVAWQDLSVMNADEQATVATKVTEAMAKYVQGNVEALIDPMDYLTKVHSFSEEEAEVILKNAIEAAEEKAEEEQAALEEMMKNQPQGALDDPTNPQQLPAKPGIPKPVGPPARLGA